MGSHAGPFSVRDGACATSLPSPNALPTAPQMLGSPARILVDLQRGVGRAYLSLKPDADPFAYLRGSCSECFRPVRRAS